MDPQPVEIPNRALFKASEVCELLHVQPYVLRSWEAEFPDLGVSKTAGGPRIYRRTDVERVIRIKHLVVVEGLTLAGARRKIEEEAMPIAADEPAIDELLGRHARERLTTVKRGLQSLLELLSIASPSNGHRAAITAAAAGAARPKSAAGRGKIAAARSKNGRSTTSSRKRA